MLGGHLRQCTAGSQNLEGHVVYHGFLMAGSATVVIFEGTYLCAFIGDREFLNYQVLFGSSSRVVKPLVWPFALTVL